MTEKAITIIGHYGMSMLMDVQRFPAVGETVEGMALDTEPGGKGYNQAVAASRLGATVNFITAVGGDEFGTQCDRDLIEENVQGRYIIRFADQRTAFALVANSADKQSQVYVYPGAIRSVAPEHIIKYGDVIAQSGLLLVQNEISIESLCAAVDIAYKADVPVIYNPAPAREMPRDVFSKLLCITPNETEAATLIGADPNLPLDVDQAIEQLHELGVKNVIITLGSEGSVVSDGKQAVRVLPLKIPVVSTTGAGDAFNAGFAVAYIGSGDIFEAAKYASVASGLQVMRPGVIASLPYREEAAKYYKDYCESL